MQDGRIGKSLTSLAQQQGPLDSADKPETFEIGIAKAHAVNDC